MKKVLISLSISFFCLACNSTSLIHNEAELNSTTLNNCSNGQTDESSNGLNCDSEQKMDDTDIIESTFETNGESFSSNNFYVFDNPIERFPLTFEATIKVSANEAKRGGVIFGNYSEETSPTINFEIYKNGHPRMYYEDASGLATDVIFNKVNVATDEKLKIAIVDDPTTSRIMCYVNGSLEQTLARRFYRDIPATPFMIGGDYRGDGELFFEGTLYDISAYSTPKNEQQIAIDTEGIDADDPNLLFAFKFGDSTENTNIVSLNNKYIASRESIWVNDTDDIGEYDYSMAIIGDMQTMTYYWPDQLHNIFDYIVEKKDSEKISFCLGLGDITEKNTTEEWELAKNQFDKLNNAIPYAVNRGNHDSKKNFNKYFCELNEFYPQTISGLFESSGVENSFIITSFSDIKYLILTLDYGPDDEVLKWAEKVILENQDCHVIVSTHAYLLKDGTFINSKSTCPPSKTGGYNDGDEIWDKLIKRFNIDLVLCGHDFTSNIIINKRLNDFGYPITQILINPQEIDVREPTGMVAMLYFSNSGKNLKIRYYSTIKRRLLKRKNQISTTIGQ